MWFTRPSAPPPAERLVIAFDVGTTFSGVAYAIITPGATTTPVVEGVTRFLGLPNQAFKVPSVLWYNRDGTLHSAAGRAPKPQTGDAHDEDQDLICVEWFKLWLRPATLPSDGLRTADLVPLPAGKTVVDVLADYLQYLYASAQRFISEKHLGGQPDSWDALKERTDFVMGHPNGWGGLQQQKMRAAAIQAGLVPDNLAGYGRVHFVAEGEASLLHCIDSQLPDAIRVGDTVMIIDAGGGTVDLSSYKFTSTRPATVEEISRSGCIFQGSIRVNLRACEYFKGRLSNSVYGDGDVLQTLMEIFENTVKPMFEDPSLRVHLKFGLRRDNDPSVGIKAGKLTVAGSEISACFEPSISRILAAAQSQQRGASEPIKSAFLVGGFAGSNWLYSRLRTALQSCGISLSRPDGHTNKAVAVGAVLYFLKKHHVVARMTRFTYGTECSVPFDPTDPDHIARESQVYAHRSGMRGLDKRFDVLVRRGTRVAENAEFRCPFFYEAPGLHDLDHISDTVICYRGADDAPNWTDIKSDQFSTLCSITADTSRVRKQRKMGPNGPYYRLDFEVILLLGLTEIKAHLRWTENGVEKSGPVSIVFDDDTTIEH